MPVNPSSVNIFAMETSCPRATLTLKKGEVEQVNREWIAERSHNSRIFDLLEEIKPVLEANPPELILVGAGPGSYSGVRVALAVADGLALAYGSRVVAVPSWEALPVSDERAMVLSDARRGGWAVAVMEKGELTGEFRIVPTNEVEGEVAAFLQEGGEILTCEDEGKIRNLGLEGVKSGLIPEANRLITAWERKKEESKDILLNKVPSPMYVRDPHITEAKRALWEKGQGAVKKRD